MRKQCSYLLFCLFLAPFAVWIQPVNAQSIPIKSQADNNIAPNDSLFDLHWTEYAQINKAMRLDALRKLDTIGQLATQTGDERQLFRSNYERIRLTFHPEEPDAIWLADSMANASTQPYRGVYHFLIAQMLSKLRPTLGLKSDVHNIRDVMKWSYQEKYDNAVRYADSAFAQLFEYGRIPATDFEFLTRPGNVLYLPEMTLADVVLMTALQHPLFDWALNTVTYNALSKAIQYHTVQGNQRILLEYEICKLLFYPFSGELKPSESPIWQGLLDLENQYGPQTAIDYEIGAFLYYYLTNSPPASEEVQHEYSIQCKVCFDKVLASATDTFYRNNARRILEKITRSELSLLTMPENLPPTPKILLPVRYRNIDTLYVTVYRIPKDVFFYAPSRSKIDEYMQKGKLQEPVMQQRFVLPNPVPYQFCHTDLFLDSLPKGNYVLLYQNTPHYDTNTILASNKINITSISVQELRHAKKHFLVFTDAVTGEPLSKLKVTKENLSGMEFHRRTDRNGRIRLLRYETSWRWDHFANDGPNCKVEYFVSIKDDDDDFYWHKPEFRRQRFYYNYGVKIPSFVMLDRPIYRPSQTVFFKAYMIRGHRMATNRTVYAILSDKNNKEIDIIELKTNKFGTIAGQFKLPENMFQGGNVQVIYKKESKKKNPQKAFSASFTISAYRLPSFKVELHHVIEPLVTGDSVRFFGRAVSFTGDPIRSANVTISIADRYSPSGIPTSFNLKTDDNGNFHFIYPTYDTNVYAYYIPAYAVVTDANGETQQAYHSLTLDGKPFKIETNFPIRMDLARKDTLQGTVAVTEHYFGHNPMNIPVKVEVFRVEEPDASRTLIYPNYKKPAHPLYSEEEYARFFPNFSFDNILSQRKLWPVKESVFTIERVFMEDKTLNIPIKHWKTGMYRIQSTAVDSLGRCDTTLDFIQIYHSADTLPTTNEPLSLNILEFTSRTLKLSVSSTLCNAHIYCYITQGRRIIAKQLLRLNQNTRQLTYKLHNSPYAVNISCFTTRNNRIFSGVYRLWDEDSPKKNFRPGTLTLNMTHWNSLFYPGAKEHWELDVIPTESKQKKEPAEVLVWMVDSSLYKLKNSEFHDWIMPYEGSVRHPNISTYWFYSIEDMNRTNNNSTSWSFHSPYTPSLLSKRYSALDLGEWSSLFRSESPHYSGGFVTDRTSSARLSGESVRTTPGRSVTGALENPFEHVRTELDAANVRTSDWKPAPFRIRRNFCETAFFLPQLQTDKDGRLAFSFTVPDQLTTWRFYAQAHTKKLHTGHLTGTMASMLPMTLQTNAPRFFREGDTLTLRAKITNRSDSVLNGIATLECFNAEDDQPINLLMRNNGDAMNRVSTGQNDIHSTDTTPFHVAANSAQEVHFRIRIPEGVSAIRYRMVARADHFGDGEERVLLVLPQRILETESQPFSVPANRDTAFTLQRLRTHIASAPPLNYTVQITTNPAWNAILALPTLMQPSHECNDEIFASLFAAAIIKQAVKRNPELSKLYAKQLQQDSSTLSPLLTNNQFKSILLEETPWMSAALRETQSRRAIAEMFLKDNYEQTIRKSINKLANNQLPDGGWSWFGKYRYSDLSTAQIVAGFYKLERMGYDLKEIRKAMNKAEAHADTLHANSYRYYQNNRQTNPKTTFPFGDRDVYYLYTRSFAPDIDSWLSEPYVQHLIGLAVKDIFKADYIRQAEVALVLHRTGRTKEAQEIVEALRQQAIRTPDKGMYWRNEHHNRYYSWYEAPLTRQTKIIEAFAEISPREEELNAMKQWLMLQKEGNRWNGAYTSTEAVYALLLGDTTSLLTPAKTTVSVGSEALTPTTDNNKQEIHGYAQRTWSQEDIVPELTNITVRTDRTHPLIGSGYWQYWTTADSMETAESGLTISRAYYHQPTENGGYAKRITEENPARLGERISVRVTITSDRDLEYVHANDPRAAAFEPVNVHERYQRQCGASWVESPRDASTEFFFRHLPKGTVIVEYDVFATQTGGFSVGGARVECLYAPEWRARSTSEKIRIQY
jgi:hypothetical protein